MTTSRTIHCHVYSESGETSMNIECNTEEKMALYNDITQLLAKRETARANKLLLDHIQVMIQRRENGIVNGITKPKRAIIEYLGTNTYTND